MEIKNGKVKIPIPCPDNIKGCAVAHYKWITLDEYESSKKCLALECKNVAKYNRIYCVNCLKKLEESE